MGFFDEPARHEGGGASRVRGEADTDRERWPTTIPATCGLHLPLGQSSSAAVAVTGMQGYPDAFVVTLTWVLRRGGGNDLLDAEYQWHGEGPVPDEYLRFGVQFSNGGRATNLDVKRGTPAHANDPDMVVVGGQGNDVRMWTDYFIAPLPPPGPVMFVAAWPAVGIPEVKAEIDAVAVRRCGAGAVQPWPDDRDRPNYR